MLNAKLQGEIEDRVIEVKRKLEREYEEKIDKLNEEKHNEKKKLDYDYKNLIQTYEDELDNLRKVEHDKNESENIIQSLRNEVIVRKYVVFINCI